MEQVKPDEALQQNLRTIEQARAQRMGHASSSVYHGRQITRAEVDKLQKVAQRGWHGSPRKVYDEAHGFAADVYGTIGAMMTELEYWRARG